jgi:hypothetical protein
VQPTRVANSAHNHTQVKSVSHFGAHSMERAVRCQ